jgi:hypothetical protein
VETSPPGWVTGNTGLIQTEDSAPWAAVKIGETPDGNWSWWVVGLFRSGPEGGDHYEVVDIIGVITLSRDHTYTFMPEPTRDIRMLMYEAPYREDGDQVGSMAMTSARSMEGAVEIVVGEWRRREEVTEKIRARGVEHE